MTGDHFRKRVSELVRRAGSQVELARKSGLSDRTIRDYLTGRAKPKGDTAQRLATAGGVRLEWLLSGAEPMEEGAHAAAEQPPAAYTAINLKRLAVAIGAVEVRMPLVPPDAKAGVIAACYDHLMSRDSADPDVLSGFLDLIAPIPAAASYKVGQPLSDEETLGARPRKTVPKK